MTKDDRKILLSAILCGLFLAGVLLVLAGHERRPFVPMSYKVYAPNGDILGLFEGASHVETFSRPDRVVLTFAPSKKKVVVYGAAIVIAVEDP